MRFVLLLLASALFTAATPRPAAKERPAPLLSQRAVREARLLIEMHLLELREQRLECVRAAILRGLPPDLIPDPRPTGAGAKSVKQTSAQKAIRSEECR